MPELEALLLDELLVGVAPLELPPTCPLELDDPAPGTGSLMPTSVPVSSACAHAPTATAVTENKNTNPAPEILLRIAARYCRCHVFSQASEGELRGIHREAFVMYTRSGMSSSRRVTSRSLAPRRVFILGAGKVGSALAAVCKHAGIAVTLRAARRGLPKRIDADLIILAVRDKELTPYATQLATGKHVQSTSICVHCAGALDATPLAPLRGACRGVAQMHPMISFASTRVHPGLARGNMHVQGDAPAVRVASAFARRIGMTPRTIPGLEPIGYHAAAALTANGAVALAAGAMELLGTSGVDRKTATAMLAPLLRSVADNIERLGFPDALTGPIRRGDPAAVARALDVVQTRAPHVVALFVAASALQVPLAAELGEVTAENLDAVRTVLETHIRAHSPHSDAQKRSKKSRNGP